MTNTAAARVIDMDARRHDASSRELEAPCCPGCRVLRVMDELEGVVREGSLLVPVDVVERALDGISRAVVDHEQNRACAHDDERCRP